MKLLLSSTVLLLYFSSSLSSKILMVPYSAEGSHYLSMAHIGEVLVEHGHNITLLINDIFDKHATTNNHGEIFSFEFYPHHLGPEGWQERKKSQDDRLLSGDAVYHAIVAFEDIIRNFSKDCEDILRNPDLRDRLASAEYDFVLADATTPCGVIVAQMLHLPHGLLLPISAVTTLTRFVSAPGDPSYIPAWQSGLSQRMSFLERSVSTLMDISWSAFFNIFLYTVHEELRPKYDVRTDVTSRNGMADAQFFLSFADWTLEYPRAHTPNMIGSAGLNIDIEKETLSEDWSTFMKTTGREGVIVMSFGTILRSLPTPVTGKFVDALSQLPYTVLWQMPNETEIDRKLPENILRHDWLPLPGLLAHNNTVLFITHAGINSMYEAIYYSKLVLAVPIFGDQPDNARRLADRGISFEIHLYKSTAQEIVEAIRKLTTETSFRKNLDHVTSLYREKPDKAREILPFVIEQTVRSRSLYLQRCKGQNMGFLQYYLIDVLAFIALLISGVSVLIFRVSRRIFQCILKF